MPTLPLQREQKFVTSSIETSTISQTAEFIEKGKYYNASYDIELFMRNYQDSETTDVFKIMNEPTYTGFKLFFHFDAKSGLLAHESNKNSALAYLKRIGENDRFDLLKRFIQVLSDVNSYAPWLFTDIEGLKELYSTKYSDPRTDAVLTINTMETLDNKIMSLVEMHKQIVFDFDRWSYVIPVNLRKFSMSIYVYDFRVFDDTSTTAKDLYQTIHNTDVKNLNHIMFDLGHCTFTEDSGSVYFDSVTNNRSDENKGNLSIRFETYVTSSLFKSITGDKSLRSTEMSVSSAALRNTVDGDFKENYVDRLSKRANASTLVKFGIDKFEELTSVDAWKRKLDNNISTLTETLIQKAESGVAGLLLGNVHGFSVFDMEMLTNKTISKKSFNDTYSRINNNQSLASEFPDASVLGTKID